MRKLWIALVLLVSTVVFAQNGDIVYKEWSFLGESKTQLDISYKLVRCSGSNTNQLFLQIFNENPNAQVARFDLEITNNSDSAKTTKEINFPVTMGRIYTPTCGDQSLSDLKIDLPAAYDPTNLSVKLTFKP